MALDLGDTYYDPTQADQNPASNIKSALVSTAKSMVYLAALNMGGAFAMNKLSGFAATKMARWNAGRLGQIARNTGATSIGGILKHTNSGKELRSLLQSGTRVFKDSLVRRSSAIDLAKSRGPLAGTVKTFTSAFKDKTTFAAVAGKTMYKTGLAGAPVAYAIDTMLGYGKESYGLESKAWYDVPGKIGNFGKWLGINAVQGLGFSAAVKGLGAVGAAGGLQVAKVFKGSLGKKLVSSITANRPGLPSGFSEASNVFNKSVLEFSQRYKETLTGRSINRALTFTKSVNSMTSSLNAAISDTFDIAKTSFNKLVFNSDPGVRSAKGSIGDPVKNALRQIRDIWTTNKRELSHQYNHSEHTGLAGVEWVNNLGDRLATKNIKNYDISSVVSKFESLAKKDSKASLLDEIFGLQPLRVKDVVSDSWQREKKDVFSQRLAGNQANLLMDHVLNMRVSPGHYKAHGSDIRGGGVDLSMFDPVHSMRKMLNATLLTPFRIPLLNTNINIGDMFGANTWTSESPTVTFWSDKRSYKLGEGAARQAEGMSIFPKGPVTTADADSSVWMTTYIDGKLAFFTDDKVHSLDWNRKLMFDYQHGARRGNENAWLINKQKARDLHGTGTAKPATTVHNKWLYQWLDPSEITLPGFVQQGLDKINAAISGKRTQYQSLANFAETAEVGPQWKAARGHLSYMRLQAGLDVYQSIRSKGALDVIGSEIGDATLSDNLSDVLLNRRSLHQRLQAADPTFAAKYNLVDEVNMLRAFPSKGGHKTVKGLTLSKDASLEDRIRLDLMEDVLNERWHAEPGSDHPLLRAAPKLLERGYINEKQFKSIKLYSTLSAFANEGIFGRFANVQSAEFGNLIKQARTRLQGTNHNLSKEIVEYVSSRNVRNVTIDKEELNFFAPTTTIYTNTSPYVSVAKGGLGLATEVSGNILESVTNMMSHLIIPFKKDPAKHYGLEGNIKYLGGSMLKIAAANLAFKALDATIASNPLLDKTSFDAGITGAVADIAATTRLGTSRVLDAIGATGIAKHLNGLMPGFVTSAPGAVIGSVVSRYTGASAIKGFALGAIGNRLLAPYLPDFTKTYDQLQKEYSGQAEVPMMKSPTWLLGPTPWEGQKVLGYSPNWYVRAKSRWKETDSLYGSAFRKVLHEPIFPLGISIGDFVDPYFQERKHYFSRPAPLTGQFGSEIPLVGPLVAGTLGRLIKPQKTMHQEYLSGYSNNTSAEQTYPFANPPPTLKEGLGMMHTAGRVGSSLGSKSSLFGTFQYADARPWSNAMGEEFLYNVQNFAGLKGFLAGSIKERIFNTPTVLPTLETAGRIASQSRFYGDANLGGLGAMTEPVRRLIQKPDSRKYGINPIPNMMPNWLPSEFLSGDPFSKIIRGELRLPGRAYTATHNVKQAMPGRSSMFGGTLEHIVQYYTGLLPPMLKDLYDITEKGDTIHKQIQDSLAAEGLLIQAEQLVYDVKNDISGHVDAIVRDGTGGKGRKALEIKSINSAAFRKLSGPKYQHVGQLNFYLRQLGLQRGQILYVDRENPSETKTYEVKYSKSRFERDIEKLNKARQIALDVMKQGVGDKFGYTYSWLDRMGILADVAPHSEEFKEAKNLVEQQIKSNILTQEEVDKYKTLLTHKQARIRKYELFPYRFKSKVLSPDKEVNVQNMNEDIKAASEYSLPARIIGSIWERFTNTNTFVTNKFFAFKDPLEHYKMLKLYGKEFTPWDEPISSFVEPEIRNMLSRTNPVSGGYKGGMLGYAFGGPFGGPVGAVLGSLGGVAYGAVNGMVRAATDSVFIPGSINKQRDINKYFDVLKFERFSRMAQLTEGLTRNEFQDAANATLNAYNQSETSVGNLFRATPALEKPYISAWLEENDPARRKEILKYLPDDLKAALKKTWAADTDKAKTSRFVKNTSSELATGYNGNAFNKSLMDPSVMLEDIKLKTVNEAGLNSHDFGLGWNDQLVRLQENYNKIGYVKPAAFDSEINLSDGPNLSSSHVRYAIVELIKNKGFNGRANVYINSRDDDTNTVTVTVQRNRAQTIINALNNRSNYLG